MSIGLPEILLVVILVLVVFGAGKLPNVMGDLAKGVKNFKKGLNEDDDTTATKTGATKTDKTKPD